MNVKVNLNGSVIDLEVEPTQPIFLIKQKLAGEGIELFLNGERLGNYSTLQEFQGDGEILLEAKEILVTR